MPTFSLGPSSSAPSQSDGGSNTNGVNQQLLEVEGNSRAGTRFIMLSRGCGHADLFPAGLGGGGAAFALAPVPESQYRDIPSLPAAAGKNPPKSGHLISGFCH